MRGEHHNNMIEYLSSYLTMPMKPVPLGTNRPRSSVPRNMTLFFALSSTFNLPQLP
jgi:hypothetical protein